MVHDVPIHTLSTAATGKGWERVWQLGLEQLIVAIALLAMLVVVAWYIIGKIRPKSVQKELSASEWLSKYRDLHSQGVLSDEEFRTIKTKLAERLQDELNSNDQEG